MIKWVATNLSRHKSPAFGTGYLVTAALGGPQRGRRTTSKESLTGAGKKRPRIVDFGTPYKRYVQQWTSIGWNDDDDESVSTLL
ncbi:jg9600 [Pararge aegeria aegeria]|uniref:Jg9600 protein n=1 Tax=Pararge aegeria aegeria TaxID=348720 RepID=A0A8S4S8F4_9NEOP|nr:jg9600 [Pararge aegeria aegeria]